MNPPTDDDVVLLQEIIERARRRLTPATWDYLVGAAETETTAKRNRQALDAIAFRPRVLRDVSEIVCRSSLFGHRLRIPVLLAPIGSLQDFDSGAGTTAARAAGEFGVIHVQSSSSAPGLEATARASDGPKIFQLYVRGDRTWLTDQVERAMSCGYDGFCLTVDTARYSRRERDLAKRYVTTARRRVTGANFQAALNWNDVTHVRSICSTPLLLKGIATAQDARIALEHGVDGIYVSNHGGRQLDHGRGSMEVLPEIVEAVGARATVIVDGGIMRGTDVVKALCLGADAVGLGRLYGFAIAAGGHAGIVRMLEILEHEIMTCLGLLGVTRLEDLDAEYLHIASPVNRPHVLSAFPLLEEGY
ncbi:MAG: alpha-hydroxy acid oxidase [Gammaproteobacteria bacterium]